MGESHLPPGVTPLVAMLASDLSYFQAARQPLENLFGPIALESPVYAFDKTAYYTPSMGLALKRQFFTFERLADPAGLADWKLTTNTLETELKQCLAPSGTPQRPINLDPGYLTGAKLVLTSTKNFAHRIYLRNGIFAEITLNFRGAQWVGHQFTFPDFKSGMYNDFLEKARDVHLRKIKNTIA
ncbi:MAG: DUF4416 family protein [Planctomycetota bacterium]